MAHAVLLTTVSDKAAARTMAWALVERHLAACVQMMPIDSVYAWKGQVEEAGEILLICKIKRSDYAEVEAAILKLHSYETPEIIMLPIEAGLSAYLSWVDAVTK